MKPFPVAAVFLGAALSNLAPAADLASTVSPEPKIKAEQLKRVLEIRHRHSQEVESIQLEFLAKLPAEEFAALKDRLHEASKRKELAIREVLKPQDWIAYQAAQVDTNRDAMIPEQYAQAIHARQKVLRAGQ